jgi:hypothetical protein
VAKLCNVYCYEFSIGFGPRFFKHYFKHKVKAGEKDKDGNEIPLFKADGKPNKINGETVFSIRAFPLGGYVSMAGEDDDSNEDGISVPKERTLLGVNHFKQICIMLAGIAMNFLLAFVLFLCDYAFCTQKATDYSSPEITVSETLTVNSSNVISPSYQAGLRSGDKILTLYQQYDNLKDANNNIKSGLIFPKSTKETTLTSYLSLKPALIPIDTVLMIIPLLRLLMLFRMSSIDSTLQSIAKIKNILYLLLEISRNSLAYWPLRIQPELSILVIYLKRPLKSSPLPLLLLPY